MPQFLRHSIWIYAVLFVLVIVFAMQARKKKVSAESICSKFTQGQNIPDYDDELARLADQGALVKIKAGDSQDGAYPIIEVYDAGQEKPFCRLHIEKQKLIFIDQASK